MPLVAVALVSAASTLNACAAANVPHPTDDVLSVGYSVGMVSSEVFFFEDGTISYRDRGRVLRTKSLRQEDRQRLRQTLSSPRFGAAIEALRASGYRPHCCDMPEVEVFHRTRGYSVGYEVCEAGEEPEVGFLVELVNEIGARYYPRRFEPLPALACKSNQFS